MKNDLREYGVPTPMKMLAELLEKAQYNKDKDIYTMSITGELYRKITQCQ